MWKKYLFLGFIIILVDRLTKWYALGAFQENFSIPLASLDGVEFFFTLTFNKGAAWGLFGEYPFILFFFRLVLITLLFILFYMTKAKLSKVALVLVLSGAISNLFDTMLWGHVVDMMHVRFWGWDYPVFNFADSAITIGAILFFVGSIIAPNDKPRR